MPEAVKRTQVIEKKWVKVGKSDGIAGELKGIRWKLQSTQTIKLNYLNSVTLLSFKEPTLVVMFLPAYNSKALLTNALYQQIPAQAGHEIPKKK